MSYQLYFGDCRDFIAKIDRPYAVVTDPPYGIDYSTGWDSALGDGAINGDKDTALRDEALRIIGDAPALVFGSWKVKRPKGVRTLLVWDTRGALGMGDLRIPWKPAHQEIYVLGNPDGFCGRRDTDVLSFPPVQSMAKNGRKHPMQKPVGLLKYLILKLKADTILDPFMGSGSTGIACMQLGRNFIGCENSEKWYAIAEKSISEAARQIPMFV